MTWGSSAPTVWFFTLFPGAAWVPVEKHFPMQSPVLWQDDSVLETLPVGILGVDTLFCEGKRVEPHGSDASCPAWLRTRYLFLAYSLSNHSQADKQEKSLKYYQNLLSQWTGRTVSELPSGNENRIHKPSR